jgi:GT2 family glycosyltransferase
MDTNNKDTNHQNQKKPLLADTEELLLLLNELEKFRMHYNRIEKPQQQSTNNIPSSRKNDDWIVLQSQLNQLHRSKLELQQQVEQLNTRLSEIYGSEGWKLLSVYYRFKGKMMPFGSPRYNKIKKMVNLLRGKKNQYYPEILPNGEPVTGNKFNSADTFLNYSGATDPFELPLFHQPKVSIIIPAYNGWKINYQCIRSILENTSGVSYEVIIADDNSTDETKDIGTVIKNSIHIRSEINKGFLQNCNHAATFAKGEYIHFLNNDTTVRPGWLSSLVELMETDELTGLCGSKLIYPDGRLQEAGGIIWQDGSAWNYGHKQDPEFPAYNYVKETDYISGASILVRKKLWEELNGFDTRYSPAYCEDSDLAFNIRQKGYKVLYQPHSVVVHYEGFSHGTETHSLQNNIKKYQAENNIKFREKWSEVLKSHQPNGIDVFHSRDRSWTKPTVLVIDHYVPQYDKDAGSRTTFQYLSLFTEIGLNVKFLGDNFYRQEPYTTALQQLGIEVLYGSDMAENWQQWMLENKENINFVLLNRPNISLKYINFLRSEMNARIFYYGHDLHYLRELAEYELTGNVMLLESSAQWKKTEYKLFSDADVVLTPSTKEKQLIQSDFPWKQVEVMPAFFYQSITGSSIPFSERKDLLFVGGFAHTPNIDAVIWFVTKVFPYIAEKIPGIRVLIVGSYAPKEIISLASGNVIIKGYVSDLELNQLYENCRIAIIPLRYGAGVKGKTAEAIAKGIPIVSTSFGIEGLVGIEQLLKAHDSADDFAKETVNLYSSDLRLSKLSADLLQYANQHLTKKSSSKFFKILFGLT